MGIFDNAKHDFFLSNGKVIKTLPELSFALKISDDHVFSQHVNSKKNDFAAWVSNSFDDDVLKNKIWEAKDKKHMINLIDERLFGLSMAETISEELPPDVAPDVDFPKETVPEIQKEIIPEIKEAVSVQAYVDKNTEENKGGIQVTAENIKQPEQHAESIVEIREIGSRKFGYKNLDRLFRKGIPSICNIIFAGKMSTGKTETAMKIALQSSKAAYISLQDSEEKIINTFYVLDNKVLEKINAGSISIKKLDTFEMARTQDIEPFTHLKEFAPDIVIVDSLSSLRLSFGDNQIGYRYFIDKLFKYFESLGIIAIFIKELDDEKEINKEFYENILSDIIITFAKGGHKLTVVKYYKSK